MDLIKPGAIKDYASEEEADADLVRYLGQLGELTGWDGQTIHQQGSERVKAQLGKLGHRLMARRPAADDPAG